MNSNPILTGVRRLPQVVFDGNSLTDQGLGNGYITSVASALGKGYDYLKMGVGGQNTAAMSAAAPTKIDPLKSTTRSKNIVVAWEILNHVLLAGANATQAYDAMAAYCLARKNAGWLVVVVTALPTNATTYPTFEAIRQTVNTNLRANYATFANALADAGNDATIGQAGQAANQTYYTSDEVHLRVPGGTIVGTYVKDAILTL